MILLMDREKEILQLLAEGRSDKEVATLRDSSVYTVETNQANLMHKLNLHNTAEIVFCALAKKSFPGSKRKILLFFQINNTFTGSIQEQAAR